MTETLERREGDVTLVGVHKCCKEAIGPDKRVVRVLGLTTRLKRTGRRGEREVERERSRERERERERETEKGSRQCSNEKAGWRQIRKRKQRQKKNC